MPTTTTPPPPAPPRLRAEASAATARLLLLGAALAAAEIAFGLWIGRFFDWGRAEALLFYGPRPWLVFVAALAAARHAPALRALAYASYLIAAGCAETLLVLSLGAGNPWPEAARALIAGAALALLFDLAVHAGLRWGGRFGKWIAAAVLLVALLLPAARRPYDAFLLNDARTGRPAGSRPAVLFMSGLPLMWGEGGLFDPSSRPALAYAELAREFDFRPIDVLDARSLAGGQVLLLAQPNRLSPEELTALDSWVRGGGRALIFADPLLQWPSELPLGDIRRPPPTHLLAPILSHWGIEIDPPARPGQSVEPSGGRRLHLDSTGVIRSRAACSAGAVARCRIGRGQVIVVPDADLFRDELWAPAGKGRHQRTADNPLIVADWLDELAGLRRPRAAGDVAWARAGGGAEIVAIALLPIALLGVAGLLLLRRRRE